MSTRNERSTPSDGAPSPDERAFVARVRDVYTPERRTAREQESFDRRLRERLEQAARPTWTWPVPIAVAAGVLGLCLLLFRGTPGNLLTTPAATVVTQPVEQVLATTVDDEAPSTVEDALLALGTEAIANADDVLPDDYVAIENLFLGGS